MAQITRFEDIRAWQSARTLTRSIYDLTSRTPFRRDFGLCDQIRRASVSIMLNIAEGYPRRSNGELRYFLYVAHGSVAEVQSALYVAHDQGYASREEFDTLYQLSDDISRMLAGFIRYLNRYSEKEEPQTTPNAKRAR